MLHERAETVRRSLAASNHTSLRLLPVIVTSKTAAEIKPDVEAAERLGIWVITREGLDLAIDRTLLPPNADLLYSQAEQEVNAALAKYQPSPAIAAPAIAHG